MLECAKKLTVFLPKNIPKKSYARKPNSKIGFKILNICSSDAMKNDPARIQMKLIQNDSNLKKTNSMRLCELDFYKYAPLRYVWKPVGLRLKLFPCLTVSTYQCEHLFSLMNSNKSSVRSRLTVARLNSVLKVQ